MKKIYKYLRSVKTKIKTRYLWAKHGRIVRERILTHYFTNNSEILPDEKPVIEYLRKNKISLLPYEFTKKYLKLNIKLKFDKKNKLHYTIFQNKKLYFRKDWGSLEIKRYFKNLLSEQDIESPHRYLTNDFDLKPGLVVIDIGSAEGIFALMVVDIIKKIFLIEPDDSWHEALKATFAPWQDKVTIINKYASYKNHTNNQITLDSYFTNKAIDFIKIDAEGNEKEILLGAKNILTENQKLKVVVASYHHKDDWIRIKEILEEYGLHVSYSKGYALFYYEPDLQYPFLRKCLIRAEKIEKI